MITKSRMDIYDYLYDLLFGVVSDNVYRMNEPQELTESDTKDGFLVIRLDDVRDESEFSGNAYGWVRAYIEAYVPPVSRGRLDTEKYRHFEDDITRAIDDEIENGNNDKFTINSGSVVSMNGTTNSNANNSYYMYVKSFIITLKNIEV